MHGDGSKAIRPAFGSALLGQLGGLPQPPGVNGAGCLRLLLCRPLPSLPQPDPCALAIATWSRPGNQVLDQIASQLVRA